jgi:RHS repeat-associated protein
MNGNGSTDIVWFTHDKKMQFLDLYPKRPHLISSIENGIGNVQRITFESSAKMQAWDRAAGLEWLYPLPNAMQVVSKLEVWEKVNENAQGLPSMVDVTEYRYHHGFYDGHEKQFRGYAFVEQFSEGDDFEAPGRIETIYDVGAPDPSRDAWRTNHVFWNGKILAQDTFAGIDLDGDGEISDSESGIDLNGDDRVSAEEVDVPVNSTIKSYRECSVNIDVNDSDKGCSFFGTIGNPSVSGTDLDFDGENEPILVVSEVKLETVIKEGLDKTLSSSAQWASLRKESSYDGYGNLVYSEDDGDLVASGDETFQFVKFISPGAGSTDGRWIIGKSFETYTAGVPLATVTEGKLPVLLPNLPTLYKHQRTYYDGLPLGTLDAGRTTEQKKLRGSRVSDAGLVEVDTGWLSTGAYIYNKHGNPVIIADALGNRRGYHYDDDELLVTTAFLELEGGKYFCRAVGHDQEWRKANWATGWALGAGTVDAGHVGGLSCEHNSLTERSWEYDEFGRMLKFSAPGERPGEATEEYEFRLGLDGRRSEIVSRSRSEAGGEWDLETVDCFDGRSRKYQTLSKIKDASGNDSHYLATRFSVFNLKNKTVRAFQGYEQPLEAGCAPRPPSVESHQHIVMKYDGQGRVVKVTNEDGTSVNTVYRPFGQRIYDENGNMTEQFNDGAARVIGFQRPRLPGQPSDIRYVEMEYDSLSRMTRVYDSDGNVKEQEFDLLDRTLLVKDPNAGTRWWQRNDLSLVTASGDANGDIVKSTYDNLGRVRTTWVDGERDSTLQETFYDTTQPGCVVNGVDECTSPIGKIVKSSYRGDGCPGGVCNSWWGYSVRKNTIYSSVELPDANGFRFVYRSQFDNVERLTKAEYPDGRSLTFSYDGAGRGSSIDYLGEPVVQMGYDEKGRFTSLTYENGVKDSFTFDQRNKLANHKTVGNGKDYQFYTYHRDAVGNIQRIDDDSLSGGIWQAVYEYDDWYRLTKATVGGDKIIPYEYNDIDNILTKDNVAYQYLSEKPNAVTSAGAVDFEYDLAGQMTQRNGSEFRWDSRQRLRRVEKSDETIGRFEYAGAGPKRMLKVEPKHSGWNHYVSKAFEVRNGVAVLMPAMGHRSLARIENPEFAVKVLRDINNDGVIRANDAWLKSMEEGGVITGAGGDSSLRPLAAAVERLLSDPGATYLHHNHIGSVTLATDSEGEAVGYRSYLPYGEVDEAVGDVGPYGFTGQELDESTGLTHFRYRYLDTSVGRWVSPDPKFLVLNKGNVGKHGEATTGYAYVGNSPIGGFDPTGLNEIADQANSISESKSKTSVTGKGSVSNVLETKADANIGASSKMEAQVTSDVKTVVTSDAQAASKTAVAVEGAETTTTTEGGAQMKPTGNIDIKEMSALKKAVLIGLALTGVGMGLAAALALAPVTKKVPGPKTTSVTTPAKVELKLDTTVEAVTKQALASETTLNGENSVKAEGALAVAAESKTEAAQDFNVVNIEETTTPSDIVVPGEKPVMVRTARGQSIHANSPQVGNMVEGGSNEHNKSFGGTNH